MMETDINDIMPPDWQAFKYTVALFDPRLLAVYADAKKEFPDLYVNVKDGKRVNDWCGLRSPACAIGAKNSAHKVGKALDFHCEDLVKLRRWLCQKAKKDGYGRLECEDSTPTWVHYDVLKKNEWDYEEKGIYVFRP